MHYKEHKKMYKAGKKWIVAALVSVSMLTWGGITANADSSTTPVDTNSEGSWALNTERQAAGQIGSDSKIIGTENTSSTTNVTPETANKATENKNITVKKSNGQTENNLTKDQNATVSNSETAATETSTTSKNTNNETYAKNDKAKSEQPATAQNTQSVKLNAKAAAVVKNAGIDPSSLTSQQIKELNKINFSKSAKSGAKMTYKDLQGIGEALIKQDARYAVPYFNAKQIQNMPAAHTRDAQTGQIADLDIWDSWPVQDAVTGYVSNYKGYQLVIAMMGIPNENDNHIYLLYNKYGDNDFSHWRNAGSIFGYHETPDIQEWSGSAIVNNDGSIQLFYTLNDTSNGKVNDQQLATATLNLNVDDNGVAIKNVENNHVLFQGDGTNYQTYQEFINGSGMKNDDYCLRDGHVVQLDNGDRYLVFEGNTGSKNYQSADQIYDWSNYGGDDAFNIKSFFNFLDNKDSYKLASLANGALGILKLTKDQKYPKVDTVYSPLVTSLMVSDELERPDIVKLGDKYYLFSAMRINRGTNLRLTAKDNQAVGDNVAMIGYVADNLMGTYKPLNGSGVVLTASVPANWRTSTYSYYAVPVKGHSDQVLVTSYMTNRGFLAGPGEYSTWAPSFLVQINPDNTTMVLARMTNQGDWIWDNTSENNNMAGVLDRNAANSAALPGEWGKRINWNLINGYGLRPHEPAEPDTPNVPNTPNTPNTPNVPDIPNIPNVPNTPNTQNTPSTPNVPNTPNIPNTPNVPNTPDTPNTPSTPNVPNTPNKPKTELPQTGNQANHAVAGLGFATLLVMFGLAGINKRRY